MKKQMLPGITLLSYFLFLISLCVFYGTSSFIEGEVSFLKGATIFMWVSFFLLLTLFLLTIIFKIVSYFKKVPTIEEKRETIEKEETRMDSFILKEKHYFPFFYLSILQNKKDLFLLGIHSLLFPLYATILYFQYSIEKRIFYFYLIFLIGIFLFILFLLLLFLPPLSKRKKENEYQYDIYPHYLLQKGKEEKIIDYDSFDDIRSISSYFLLMDRNHNGMIFEKKRMKKETKELFLSLIQEKKYVKLRKEKKTK